MTKRAGGRRGSAAPDLTEKLRTVRDALLTGLVERDVAIRLALLSALSGEHLLLLGPPGTAKSLIARRLQAAFQDARCFERLLTRFTVPEELFGPLSIKGLEEDRYERLTDAYLPTASIAFLDEIFKANSAILNALLTLLNERQFDNGTRREPTPLIAAIGASNELPQGPELGALYDRFLLRLHVGPVSSDGFEALLALRGESTATVPDDARLSADDLQQVRAKAQEVVVSPDVIALLSELREWCQAQQLTVSDRRWRKIVKLLQVSALTNGRSEVSIWDCWLLQHCLWEEPEQREAVYDWYAERVGASAAMDPSRLTKLVVAWEGRLQADRNSRSQCRDASGRLLFVRDDESLTHLDQEEVPIHRNGSRLYLAPPGAEDRSGYRSAPVEDRRNSGSGFTADELDALYVPVAGRGARTFGSWASREAYLADESNHLKRRAEYPPALEPTRHKASYKRECVREICQLRSRVQTYESGLAAHLTSLRELLANHLWVSDEFIGPATASLYATAERVAELLTRIDKVEEGVRLLPEEAERSVIVDADDSDAGENHT